MDISEWAGRGLRWPGCIGIAIVLSFTLIGRYAGGVHPELPVVHCTVICDSPFDPNAPVVTVVYSNASTSAAIAVTIPADAGERRLWGPGVGFDNREGIYIDPVYIERNGDRMPTRDESILPGRICTATFTLGDRFRIPRNWTTLSVRPVHEYQYSEYLFHFDRSGTLVRTELMRHIDMAKVRADRDRFLDARARAKAMWQTGMPHEARSGLRGADVIATNMDTVAERAKTAAAEKSPGSTERRAAHMAASSSISGKTRFDGMVFLWILLGVMVAGGFVAAIRRGGRGGRGAET